MFDLFTASWYFSSIITLYLILKYLRSDLKSLGSMRSAHTNEFDIGTVCCLLCNVMHR
jgi:hypothetical protein